LRSLKARQAIPGNGGGIIRQIGAEAMSLYVLDAVFRIFGIRAHIPQNDDFGGGRSQSSVGSGTNALFRVLAAVALAGAVLALALWMTVWLAINLL
jgi:hypothetical protein